MQHLEVSGAVRHIYIYIYIYIYAIRRLKVKVIQFVSVNQPCYKALNRVTSLYAIGIVLRTVFEPKQQRWMI